MNPASAPDSFPIGVRAPATMTASAIPCTSGSRRSGYQSETTLYGPTIVGSHERHPAAPPCPAPPPMNWPDSRCPTPTVPPWSSGTRSTCSRAWSPRTRTPAGPSTSRRCRCPSWPPTRPTWRSWPRRSTSTPCGPRSSSRCPPSASSTASPRRALGPPATRSTTTWSAPTPPASCCGRARRCATGRWATRSPSSATTSTTRTPRPTTTPCWRPTSASGASSRTSAAWPTSPWSRRTSSCPSRRT